MRTLELNSDYDIFVQNDDIAIQKITLATIRQTIVNKLSLIKGETPDNTENGLDLNLIFGDTVSYDTKIAEIKRVILLEPSVVSVDDIDLTVDRALRVGYFKCYITVNINGESQQTTVGFGV